MPSVVWVTYFDVSVTPFCELPLWFLSQAGWDVTLVAPNATSSLVQQVQPYKCKLVNLPKYGVQRDLAALSYIAKTRLNSRAVIFVQSQSLGVRAWIPLLGSHRHAYYTVDFYSSLSFPWRKTFEGLLARSAALNFNAEYHRAYVFKEMHGVRQPIIVLPPNLPSWWPIEIDSLCEKSQAGIGDNEFRLSLHGTYSELRMTREMLEAMSMLPPHVTLLMGVTNETRPGLQRLIQFYGIGDRVLFRADRDYCKMLNRSTTCDAGILLYRNNDLGNYFQAPGRLTEYLAAGLPVVASNHVGLKAIVTENEIGTVVNAESPRDIAEGVLRIMQNRSAYTREKIRGTFVKAFALEHWIPLFLESMLAMYEGRCAEFPTASPIDKRSVD